MSRGSASTGISDGAPDELWTCPGDLQRLAGTALAGTALTGTQQFFLKKAGDGYIVIWGKLKTQNLCRWLNGGGTEV